MFNISDRYRFVNISAKFVSLDFVNDVAYFEILTKVDLIKTNYPTVD
mgnify:CR=1 FL=1